MGWWATWTKYLEDGAFFNEGGFKPVWFVRVVEGWMVLQVVLIPLWGLLLHCLLWVVIRSSVRWCMRRAMLLVTSPRSSQPARWIDDKLIRRRRRWSWLEPLLWWLDRVVPAVIVAWALYKALLLGVWGEPRTFYRHSGHVLPALCPMQDHRETLKQLERDFVNVHLPNP